MLSKLDRNTIISVLDIDGIDNMMALIDDIVLQSHNDGYTEGYTDGYHDACDNNME